MVLRKSLYRFAPAFMNATDKTATATPDHAAAAPTEARATPAERGQRRGRRPQRPAGTERSAPANTANTARTPAPTRQHPVLDQLAELVPVLFGETLLPLKRGIFEDLLAAYPEVLEKDSLKVALGLHARSTRYLTVVASGLQRHDLSGQPVEELTPEQVHHALIEVFRRRGARSREDLRPKLRQRILIAFEASGLPRDEYAQRVHSRDDEVNQLTHDALSEAASRAAREEALLRAFDASGKTLEAFADMYGMHLLDAHRTLERARARMARQAAVAAQATGTQTPAEQAAVTEATAAPVNTAANTPADAAPEAPATAPD
jgi:ProP effector